MDKKKPKNFLKKLKKTDKVIVIAGKDKGKSGVILALFPREQKVTVEGVNICAVHKKANQKGEEGGIIPVPKPIHISNVMILDPASLTKKGKTKTTISASRVGIKIEKDSKTNKVKRTRYLKKTKMDL